MAVGGKKLLCGACGCSKVTIYKSNDDDNDLLAECSACKSVTIISFNVKLTLDWGNGSKGILCDHTK